MIYKFSSVLKRLESYKKYVFIHVLLIFVFTNLYYFLSKYSNEQDRSVFGNSWENCLYYSTTTHFTIGFGDMTATSLLLRRITILQVFLAFLFFTL